MILPEDMILENRYRIDRLLGQGGMGAIYRGYDLKLKIPLAIKENFFHTPHSMRQFEQEALLLARLRHPNLPRVIDHFTFEGQQYLVMDYIEGHDLWEMVKRQEKPFTEAQALDYLMQICEAVSYLHKQTPPIIHRDIKPQNIKITSEGKAVLVDFGIAKVAQEDARTSTGARGVTPGYSPPEQYSGQGTDPRSDIYALGATLYAILTGQKPPDSVSLVVGEAKFQLPEKLNPKISHTISQAIVHAMQGQPSQRPVSVSAWQAELVMARTQTAKGDGGKTEVDVAVTLPEISLWLVGPEGQSYGLKAGSLILGRAKTCDILINDSAASRQHAILEFDGQDCTIYDEGSANGTFINEQRVGKNGQPLHPGDEIRIGKTIFTLYQKTAAVPVIPLPPAEFAAPPVDPQATTTVIPGTALNVARPEVEGETSADLLIGLEPDPQNVEQTPSVQGQPVSIRPLFRDTVPSHSAGGVSQTAPATAKLGLNKRLLVGGAVAVVLVLLGVIIFTALSLNGQGDGPTPVVVTTNDLTVTSVLVAFNTATLAPTSTVTPTPTTEPSTDTPTATPTETSEPPTSTSIPTPTYTPIIEAADQTISSERRETLFISGTQWGPPHSWNPFNVFGHATGTTGLCYETLFIYDPMTNEYTPWLAESGEWISDNIYELNIRQNVIWSDGKPFTTADVKFTFELGKTTSIFFAPLWRRLDNIKEIDGSTLQFTFSEPPYQEWANYLYHVPIVPQHLWSSKTADDVTAGANENPVGTGPYLYETHAQDRMIWVKNDKWWANVELGLDPAPKRIVDIINNDISLDLLRRGDLDLSNNFLPNILTVVDGHGIQTYYPEPPYMLSANTVWLIMNNQKTPMDDPAFRKAMAFAVDTDQIVEGVYGNIVGKANPTGLLPMWNQYVNQDVVKKLGFSYNPDQAKKLLADAGYKDIDNDSFVEAKDGSKIELKIIVPRGWTDWEDSIKVVANSAQAVGINLQPDSPDYSDYVDAYVNGNFDMMLINETQLSNTPWTYYDWIFQHPTTDIATIQNGNYSRYDNKKAFDLVDQLAKVRIDDVKGMKVIVSQLQEIQLSDMPLIPLWYNSMWAQYNNTVWTNWPSSANDSNHYLPTAWRGYWNMTSILMLSNLKPVGNK